MTACGGGGTRTSLIEGCFSCPLLASPTAERLWLSKGCGRRGRDSELVAGLVGSFFTDTFDDLGDAVGIGKAFCGREAQGEDALCCQAGITLGISGGVNLMLVAIDFDTEARSCAVKVECEIAHWDSRLK